MRCLVPRRSRAERPCRYSCSALRLRTPIDSRQFQLSFGWRRKINLDNSFQNLTERNRTYRPVAGPVVVNHQTQRVIAHLTDPTGDMRSVRQCQLDLATARATEVLLVG